MKFLCFSSRRAIFVLCLAAVLGLPLSRATAQYKPATAAFENSPVCSDSDLSNDHDLARGQPEWKPVNGLTFDPFSPRVIDKPTILEGRILAPPSLEQSGDIAHTEVAEEDLPWNHYTHDFTIKVTPDPDYQYLLSSWVRYPGETISGVTPDLCALLGGNFTNNTCVLHTPDSCPDGSMDTTCHHDDMEVEWESASLMDASEGFNRIWGAVPEFVWPAVYDRVWVSGRWIFDCGHPGVHDFDTSQKADVQYSTEIHPPRALVTFRLNHPALDSFPVPRTSAPNFPGPQSYLPVTGEPVILPPDAPNSGPTNVPLTEADIFVSGNGGGANDLCNIISSDCPGHTGPVIAINDFNYVFDIYPPGTDYDIQLDNKTFKITPPVPDASLQWRTVDHSTELPSHTCGTSDCKAVDPILCLIGASTAPPPSDPIAQTQMGTTCPTPMPGERPTRLRVILPFFTDAFNGKVENYLAQSILLGWDDVPAPPNTPAVRTFKVRLKHLTVVENGEGSTTDGDWRVFVNVGGQWRYMSNLYDAKSDGTSTCNGADSLTNNGTNDCYSFENTPWTVSVTDGSYIHVAVGGYESDPIDGGLDAIFAGFCRTFPGGCDAGVGQYFGLYAYNDDRIGTFEFDLDSALTNYAPPPSFTTEEPVCHPDYVASIIPLRTCDELRYQVEFSVDEVPAATPPASQPFQVGDPHYGNFVSSATPFVLSSADANTEGFQYRFHHQGDSVLPTYPSILSFPVHWAHADLPPNSQSVPVYLNDGSSPDGLYDFQYSAQNFANLLEPRHAQTTILDNTPPVIAIVQPAAAQYPHSATLTVNFSVSDGTGSGVQSSTPKMDGLTTLMDGTPVANNLAIHLLTELSLGMHTFTVNALDNVDNPRMSSVTFEVIVTPESIKGDVTQFLQGGAIKNNGVANSLLAKLDAAAAARARGQCSTAANLYQAFISELQAQSGKGVAPAAAQIMILDARYLIAHCP